MIAWVDVDSEDDGAERRAWDAYRKASDAEHAERLARNNALKRWAGVIPEERSAAASKAAHARWTIMRASTHPLKRHRVKRARKRRGGL